MRIPSWTVDEMLAEKPCKEYTRERLEELWAGHERRDLLQILGLNIPATDKVWACCRDTPLREPWLFGRVLTRCIRDHALNCGVSAVEQWAQRWLSGEDRSAYAADASADAAWAAYSAWVARAAAEAAWYAQVATHYAAECATRAAANAADWAANAAARAAWSAVCAAGAAAGAEQERERQLQDMREVIAEMCEGD